MLTFPKAIFKELHSHSCLTDYQPTLKCNALFLHAIMALSANVLFIIGGWGVKATSRDGCIYVWVFKKFPAAAKTGKNSAGGELCRLD